MSNDTVFSPAKASGGVHEQIESFLQTVMQGLMRPHDQQAAEQQGKPGRPVSLPSVTLWMAVLIAVLRGLKSQRAIWRLMVAEEHHQNSLNLEKTGNARKLIKKRKGGKVESVRIKIIYGDPEEVKAK